MAFYMISALCIVIFGLSAAEELSLPFTTCKRNSTNYSSCLKRAVKEAWPRFAKGLPEYDFPSLDPLVYGHFYTKYNNEGIYAEITIDNMIMTGLSKTRFSSVRTHFLPDNVFRVEVDVLIPSLFNKGDLDAKGILLNIFNLNGIGHYNVTIENCTTTWDLIGHVANDTWVVENFRTYPQIASLKVYLRDFFDGNQELNNFAMNIANEYWPLFYRIMLPTSSKVWDAELTKIINTFFSKVPFSKVFP